MLCGISTSSSWDLVGAIHISRRVCNVSNCNYPVIDISHTLCDIFIETSEGSADIPQSTFVTGTTFILKEAIWDVFRLEWVSIK